jgi:hypothetical protein
MTISLDEQIARLTRQRDAARAVVRELVAQLHTVRARAMPDDPLVTGGALWCDNCGRPARRTIYQPNRDIAVCPGCVLPTDPNQPVLLPSS